MNDPGKDPLNLIFCSSYPFLRGGKNESACHYMYIRSKFRSDKAGSRKFELLYPKKNPFVKKSSVKWPGSFMNCWLSVSSTSLQFE